MTYERPYFIRRANRLLPGGFFLLLLCLNACDFTVTNPGPVQDDFLSNETARGGIVNGAGRMLAEALNWVAYTGAAVSREVTPAGSIGSFGITIRHRNGQLDPDENNTHWELAHRARWVAERGIERLRESMGESFSSSEDAAQILLYAAYANRLLGENFCCAVIDGGAPQPGSVYFERAEGHFTEALNVAQPAGASDLAAAALAGRASARMWLGNWAGAVEDASAALAAGGDDFAYVMPYFNIDTDQYNRVYYAGSGDGPYRAHSAWNTANGAYFEATGDARVTWTTDPDTPFGDATVDGDQIPWQIQQKHGERTSPIRLSSSQEMKLMLAENALVTGSDVTAAVDLMNEVRALAEAEAVSAVSLEEAWTRLKAERRIELWLEARRLGDIRRWEEAGRPGAYDAWETANWKGEPYSFSEIDLSFPISESEMDTNPNVSQARPF